MNIFILHEDPRVSAQMQCDRHATKMVVEQAQMLCFAHLVANNDKRWVERNITFKLNKGHAKHPCTLWLMEDERHYAWGYRYLQAMLREYDYRYDGLRRGKYAGIIQMLDALARIPGSKTSALNVKGEPDEYVLAMNRAPECYSENAVEAYRRYYVVNKQGFATWKRRRPPTWFESGLRQYQRHGDISRVLVV